MAAPNARKPAVSARHGNRAATHAREQILSDLRDDHRRVGRACLAFDRLDVRTDGARCQDIVQRVLQELSIHAAVDEQLMYPAARAALANASLIDRAEVEHEALQSLMDRLKAMEPGEPKYGARFKLLCATVLNHVEQEEGELFPQLELAALDWQRLAELITERRGQLAGAPDPQIDGIPPDPEAAALHGNPAMDRITPPRS